MIHFTDLRQVASTREWLVNQTVLVCMEDRVL
jgi:hypothetical protein